MKSKAAVGRHPLHPMFVVIPIGSWFATLVGDISYAYTGQPFWYQFSFYTMFIGLIGAALAGVFGMVDYFGVRMSAAGRRVATMHMVMNLVVSAAYAFNLWLRWDNAALSGARWNMAFWIQVLSYLALGVSGWLGGELSYRHKVGVVEHGDPEATEIGMDELEVPAREAVPGRDRGLQG